MNDTWAGISVIIGPILSFIYEKAAKNWHGKMAKFWVFFLICLGFGGALAIGTGEVSPLNGLTWNTYEEALLSLGAILKWAGGLLGAATAFFFTVMKQNREEGR